jgi:GNAT superfamily N-acetyltransferase
LSSIEVRPFRRDDRDQLTRLVNAHVAAVVPGISVSVSTVLHQLEREPDEFIVDPWVAERATFVAAQRDEIVAAAHVLRYADDERVGPSYRRAGEIRWVVHWPVTPLRGDTSAAADGVLAASVAQLERWRVERQYADGALPAPGVYGIPEQWPHVAASLERAGFRHDGRVEIVLIADVAALRAEDGRVDGVTFRRTLGVNGTRLSAVVGSEQIGLIEVEPLQTAERTPRLGGWADVGNLHVDAANRRRGIGRSLVARAAEWLRLGGVDRLLAYADADDRACLEFLRRVGFLELTRTRRGWRRT